MMTHRYTVAEYEAGIAQAIEARDLHAVPQLLTLMAMDGFEHEAEQLRLDLLDILIDKRDRDAKS